MGVDILYWCDNNYEIKNLKGLKYHLERYLSRKICIICEKEKEKIWLDNNFQIKKYESNKTLFEIKELYDFLLYIYDEAGKICDYKNQDISRLLEKGEIEVTLESLEYEDLEIRISSKAVRIDSWELTFGFRFFTFVKKIGNMDKDYQKYFFQSLYLIDELAKAFNSSVLLAIGDSSCLAWEEMDSDLVEGASIPEVLEKYQDIDIITESMILEGKFLPYNDPENWYRYVFLFSLEKLFPYFEPCTIAERYRENAEINTPQEEYFIQSLEVSCIFDKEQKDLGIKKKSVLIVQNSDERYECTRMNFDRDGNLILKDGGLYFENKTMKNLINKALALDYTSVISSYKKVKKEGKICCIKYRSIYMEIEFSLWLPVGGSTPKSDFEEFVDLVFEKAEEPPKNCISFDNGLKLIGIPIINTKNST